MPHGGTLMAHGMHVWASWAFLLMTLHLYQNTFCIKEHILPRIPS